ncbi:MAG: hypothetical protein ACOY31_05125 [Bacillota bacterium]
MEFMEKIKHWLILRVTPQPPDQPDLLGDIREALKELKISRNLYNYIDHDFIDYMVHRMNAAERHYTTLLTWARNEGLKAWPDNLKEPCKNVSILSSAENNDSCQPVPGTF